MKRTASIALAIGLVCGPVAEASVRPGALPGRSDPDWPCIQRKVPELSVVSVWTGPPVEEAFTRWREHADVVSLVNDVAARRMPLEEATAAIASFAHRLPADVKAERLTMLFAGLFQTLDRERKDVIAGIERYGRKQKEMAEQIRADMARASDLAASGASTQAAELQNQLIWETRIFNERRDSLTFVCEVPTSIEQRLFVLARAIGNELPS